VPRSLRELASGRTRIILVKVHEVGEPAPEESWLRSNAVVFDETDLGFSQNPRVLATCYKDFLKPSSSRK